MKKLQDCMTSELLFQSMQTDTSTPEKESFIAEYERRLRMMGLTDEQTAEFRKADELAINNGCYIKSDVLLSTEPFIKENMDTESIKMENCTFSELIYLTDDANSAYIRDHHWLPAKAWALVCEHALNSGTCKAAYENRNRMKGIGLTEEQEGIFVKNECKIAQRLRWGYTEELAWC